MIDKNQQALLELLKASLFGAEPHFPEGVDWDAVLQEAKDQTVVALAAPAVLREEAAKWHTSVTRNTVRFFQILDEQTKLVKLFQDAEIPIVILKGCAAAMYYPVPMQRAMGDIDFIVPPERFEDARILMEENGYVFNEYHGVDRDYSYTIRDVVVELHHRYSDKNWDIEPLIMNGFSDVHVYELYNHRFPALPEMINGLVLLDHVRHHLMNGLGIRQIIDWMMFVHTVLSDEIWENSFSRLAQDAGLETLAKTMTKMCMKWFAMPDDISWCDSADETTAQDLLETVFCAGNFGVKHPDEPPPVEIVTLNVRKKGIFRYLQARGEQNWKKSRNHRFLRRFAWLYQIFRYIKRGMAELFRGGHFVRDLSSGSEKFDFLERLGLNR